MDTAPPSYEEARNEGQTIKGLDPQPPRYSDPESQMPTPSGEIEINVQQSNIEILQLEFLTVALVHQNHEGKDQEMDLNLV